MATTPTVQTGTDSLRDAMVAAAKQGALDALREAGLLASGGGEDFHKDNPPPELGADKRKAWRNALDLQRAGKLRACRIGRRMVIRREDWAAYVASCATAPKPPRSKSDPFARFRRRAA